MRSPSKHTSVKNMLLGSMILLPTLPLVLILSIGFYYFTDSVENSTTESMKRIITDHGLMIDRFLEERQGDLELVLNMHSFEELRRPDRLEKIYSLLQQHSPAFADLGIFDEQGLHIAYVGPYPLLAGRIYKDAEWFQMVMNQRTYISDVFLGFRQEPHFIIAIARQEGERRWVLRATIDSRFFNDLVKKVHFGTTGEAYLINEKGVLQTDRRSGGDLMDHTPDWHLIPPGDGTVQSFIARDGSGVQYQYSLLELKDGKWRLILRREVAEAFTALRMAGYLIVFILIAGGSIITLSALSLTSRILRRIDTAEQSEHRLKEQLVRASRLAELGQMAAGVAHEINNPLQIIKSEQSLIEMDLAELKEGDRLPDDPLIGEIRESFEQIRIQVDRCAEITQAVLKFGRQSTPKIEPVPLHVFIPEIVHMVSKKASVHGIAVETQLSECPAVKADPAQLQQVLLNLFNNAVDAILDRHGVSGGTLKVSARQSGRRVIIQVSDNGVGIDPADMDRIFTPFFTTKPVGKGTGLGLSVCA
jgi:two-component system, NtrC family, sensor kinase